MLDATFPVSSGPDGLMEALDNICMESSEALRGGNCQVRCMYSYVFSPNRVLGEPSLEFVLAFSPVVARRKSCVYPAILEFISPPPSNCQ